MTSEELLHISHQDSETHQNIVANLIESWSKGVNDLVLLSEDGEAIETQKHFLSVFSPVIRDVLESCPPADNYTISIPASKLSMSVLMEVLLKGRVEAKSKDVLTGAKEAAISLGIDIENMVVENREEIDVKKKQMKVRSRKKKEKKKQNLGEEAGDSSQDENGVEKETTSSDENEDGNDLFCKECGKSFNNKSGLKQHKVVHMKEKPFKCDDCEKTFSQKGNLYTHRLLHTGEKPFKCSVCDKSWAQKGNMKTHMLREHGRSE